MRTLTLSDAFDSALEPAPQTPTKGDKAGAFRILSGTIKATYNAHRGLGFDKAGIEVAPWMNTGNTGKCLT
jgi:Gly-Xaa carboxypeptidase